MQRIPVSMYYQHVVLRHSCRTWFFGAEPTLVYWQQRILGSWSHAGCAV